MMIAQMGRFVQGYGCFMLMLFKLVAAVSEFKNNISTFATNFPRL